MKFSVCNTNYKVYEHCHYGWSNTIVVGQDWRKIILKIDAGNLGKLFFQKTKKLYGEKKNIGKIFYF